MDTTESRQNMEEYVRSEEFWRNLENQKEYFDSLLRQIEEKNHHWDFFPFTSWNHFIYHYAFVRAGLSSLLKNPDTMHDTDLIELCNTWKHQRFCDFELNRLEALYLKLREKPVFRENYIFRELFGNFVKGFYSLMNGECYTDHFFDLDE